MNSTIEAVARQLEFVSGLLPRSARIIGELDLHKQPHLSAGDDVMRYGPHENSREVLKCSTPTVAPVEL